MWEAPLVGGRPTGTVTFLFTDIEGSTRLWQDHPEPMRQALARHDAIVADEVERASGIVVKALGDGVLAAFARPTDAIDAALSIQRSVNREPWVGIEPLRVRMGVHTGAVEERDGDYFGPALNRAARLTAVGHGGLVLVSNATAELVRDGLHDDVGLLDLGYVGLRDLSRPERLWQLTAPGLAKDFPPLRSTVVDVSLPEPRTTLIGRDDAIRWCVGRLAEVRLLTLTGAGGSGKTRLAIAVAASAAEQFADGVWFIDLAVVADPALVAAAVTVGLHMTGVLDPARDLRVYLAGKRALIVLDNCEHLLDECSALVDQILVAAPELRIVATSRESLGVEGEHSYRVTSLVPETQGTELFEDRARAVAPGLVIDDANRPIIAELCRRLDGIPLAIELAAAQTSVLTPAEILTLLDERFTLLSGGRRRGRQATLGSVLDWSYQLLNPAQQHALRCAAVLPGSFVPESFAAATGSTRAEGLALLRALVSKSLANVEQGDNETRYRLLETVRLYGESMLTAEEATSARDRLVAWVRAMLEQAESTPRMALAVREVDTIRVALNWARATGDYPAVVEVTLAAAQGWINELLVDAREWLAVVEGLDSTLPRTQRCAWRARRGFLSAAFGGVDIGHWADAALQFADEPNHEAALTALLLRIMHNNFLEPQIARHDLDRVLDKRDAPAWLRAMFALWDGVNYLFLGDYVEAERRFARAESVAIELHQDFALLNARLARSAALGIIGDPEAALALAMIVANDRATRRQWFDHVITEQTLAVALAQLGRLDDAREHVRLALRMARGQYAHVANAAGPAVVAASAIALADGDYSTALTLARGARRTGLAARDEQGWVLATRYTQQLRTTLDPSVAAHAIARAKAMSVDDLIALAEEVAGI